jgi:hypothetical protein
MTAIVTETVESGRPQLAPLERPRDRHLRRVLPPFAGGTVVRVVQLGHSKPVLAPCSSVRLVLHSPCLPRSPPFALSPFDAPSLIDCLWAACMKQRRNRRRGRPDQAFVGGESGQVDLAELEQGACTDREADPRGEEGGAGLDVLTYPYPFESISLFCTSYGVGVGVRTRAREERRSE